MHDRRAVFHHGRMHRVDIVDRSRSAPPTTSEPRILPSRDVKTSSALIVITQRCWPSALRAPPRSSDIDLAPWDRPCRIAVLLVDCPSGRRGGDGWRGP